jgi:hypothetical protein
MHGNPRGRRLWLGLAVALAALATAVAAAAATQASSAAGKSGPKFSEAKAFDTSKPLKELAKTAKPPKPKDLRPERGPAIADNGPAGDAAVQSAGAPLTIGSPLLTFEGLSNQDNFNTYGFRVNPPDPVGDVGPNNYVEVVNLDFAIYDKQGNRLLGPTPIGALWDGFAVDDCTDASGDGIVLYDQTTDRWIIGQFTTRGLDDPTLPFYNCVAVSTTGDPTGEYFRYAFRTDSDEKFFFPDYPKYGVWSNSYVLTSRDFGPVDEYGISVYALEKNKMVNGEAKARAVHFFLDSNEVPIT